MKGVGVAYGAVSVLNAIPTGIGGAVGLDIELSAEVEVLNELKYSGTSIVAGEELPIHGGALRAVAEVAGEVLGYVPGLRAFVVSEVPVGVGLKSSSALINALILALMYAHGIDLGAEKVALMASRASKIAGLTITGALDDHTASLSRGVFITDNLRGRIIRRLRIPSYYAVIHVPTRKNPINSVDAGVFKRFRRFYSAAAQAAMMGDWLSAMRVNGLLTALAVGVELEPLVRVLKLPDVLAAGVTGKGPAMFALTHDPGHVAEVWEGMRGYVIVTKVRG